MAFQGQRIEPDNIAGVRPGRQSRTLAAVLLILCAAFPSLSASATEGDPEKGAKLFKACKGCHEVGANARNGVGPHLDGLFERPAGALEGFKYSSAMKRLGAEGMVWNAFSLDLYLEKPRAYAPGTRMSFRGMADRQDRTHIIAYLKELSTADPASAVAVEPIRQEMGAAAMQLDGDVDYGEYLSSECVTCHQVSGRADGIPSIIGWPKKPFIRALFEYKTNIRSHQVMQNMTVNLGNEEIAALAAYFGTIDPQ